MNQPEDLTKTLAKFRVTERDRREITKYYWLKSAVFHKVGIDKVRCEMNLNSATVNNLFSRLLNMSSDAKGLSELEKVLLKPVSLKPTSKEWGVKPDKQGKRVFYFIKDYGDGRKFHFTIRESVRNETKKPKGSSVLILFVNWNPSRWMPHLKAPRAVRGENYVAGSAEAVRLSLRDLEAILAEKPFLRLRSQSGAKLNTTLFSLTGVDVARDYTQTEPERSFSQYMDKVQNYRQHHGYCPEVLGLFLYACPRYVNRANLHKLMNFHVGDFRAEFDHDDFESRPDLLQWLKNCNERGNPSLFRYNSLYRCTGKRTDVFYFKMRKPKDRTFVNGGVGGLRFEHRLTKKAEIERVLGVNTLEKLYDLVRDSDRWHEGGRKGKLPVLEALVDERMRSWNTPTSFVLSWVKKFVKEMKKPRYEGCLYTEAFVESLPATSEEFIFLLRALESEMQEANCVLLGRKKAEKQRQDLREIRSKFKVGEKMDHDAHVWLAGFLNQAMVVLRPYKVHRIAYRAVGRSEFVKRERVRRGITSKDYKASVDRYDRLMGLVIYILDFCWIGSPKVCVFDKREIAIEYLTYAPDS